MLTLLLICLLSFFINGCDQSSATKDHNVSNDTVGIYDSRCVAIAYYNSQIHENILKEKMAERDKARESGDTKTVKELESWGNKMQKRAHLQGFSTEPVDELLTCVSDGIERIKTEKKLDRICSKWLYKGDMEKTIDITNDMVMLYDPPAKSLESIAKMKGIQPYPKWKINMMDIFH